MKMKLWMAFLSLVFATQLTAQRNCSSYTYLRQQLQNDPSLQVRLDAVEIFSRQHAGTRNNFSRTGETSLVIKIPVVVHILYHQPNENITDAQVNSQIEALNRCFRRLNADTVNTPAAFRPFATDCEIEFKLATSDPRKRNTSGITRKYTPVTQWKADDKMKFSAEMGDDAWDPGSYLNIWVCNLDRVMGYSSVTGGTAGKDGVAIGFNVFGTINSMAGFDKGKTAVHEVGHWLNLKHLWGDANCGDDFVDDTPKQSGYNIECPSGIRISCGNSPLGDMYMNYMDFTSDACMNIFTKGQKARMRALFEPGGLRNSILYSTGLNAPLIFETPVPEESPKWLHPQLFPNPVTTEMTLDLAYDIRWIGKMITVINLQGQAIIQLTISSKYQKIDVSKLKPGLYFLEAKKDDGESYKMKFIKL